MKKGTQLFFEIVRQFAVFRLIRFRETPEP